LRVRRRIMHRIFLFVFTLLFFSMTPLHAQNATSPQSLECIPNYNTISVYAYFSGDANNDNTTVLNFRKTGQPSWSDGHPLTRTADNRYAGSIFKCTAGTSYEVRVTFSDPDGVNGGLLPRQVTTRDDVFPSGSGDTWYVAVNGNDGGAGNSADPFATIQHAYDVAGAGDLVIVKPGLYREHVQMTKSGTANAYITFRSEIPGAAILEGCNPDLAVVDSTDNWQPTGNGVYSTVLSHTTGYVAVEGARLYHYGSLSDLESQAAGVPGGWYFQSDGNILYVRLPDNADPDTHIMQVGQLTGAFTLTGAGYLIFDGFTLRYYGTDNFGRGLYLNGSSNILIRGNLIHNCRYGIYVKEASSANITIQDNELYDTSIIDWPWSEVKGTDGEASGISLKGGSGNVVRRNVIHGFFDGIGISTWGDLNNESLNRDMDIHHNHIFDSLDDPTEPEGACMNLRFYRNIVHTSQMGISLAPITVGPVFVIRECFYDFWKDGFKVSIDTSGRVYLYHNIVYTNRSEATALTSSGRWYNMVFKNNAFRTSFYIYEDVFTKPAGSIQMDYNNIYTTSAIRFIKWENIRYDSLQEFRQAKGHEIHGMSTDPGFVNPINGDFHLSAGSPMIDAGVVIPNINDDYSGDAPDLGVYEFSMEDPPPGPPTDLHFID